MSRGLLISRTRKIELCSLSIKNPSLYNVNQYKTYKNIYSKAIRTAKKLYFEKSFVKYQSDAKKTWDILRKAINNKSKSDNSINIFMFRSMNSVEMFMLFSERINRWEANGSAETPICFSVVQWGISYPNMLETRIQM